MNKPNLILVIGADGIIGSALFHKLQQTGYKVIGTTRHKNLACTERLFLDLEKPISAWNPLPVNFSIAYICAAQTSIKICANNPDQTHHINVTQTEAVAKILINSGGRIVFLSTNQVYDGSTPYQKSEDPVCPQTEYGRQKAEAERRLLALSNEVAIIRLTKVLSWHMSLLKEWSESLLARKPIHPFLDMVLSPVSLDFVVATISRLTNVNYGGILQISGSEDITYDKLAGLLAQRIGADQALIQPIKIRDIGDGIENPPKYSTLDTSILKNILGVTPPSIWDTLGSALSDLAMG